MALGDPPCLGGWPLIKINSLHNNIVIAITVCDIYWLHYLYKCRAICQNGDIFEGKDGCIMNNDGTVLYNYKQGVNKYSNGVLHEGNVINHIWNGKVNDKWENGDIEISEILDDKNHGPVTIYDVDGKVHIDYHSNGEKIFLI